jgi:hypothetical protein
MTDARNTLSSLERNRSTMLVGLPSAGLIDRGSAVIFNLGRPAVNYLTLSFLANFTDVVGSDLRRADPMGRNRADPHYAGGGAEEDRQMENQLLGKTRHRRLELRSDDDPDEFDDCHHRRRALGARELVPLTIGIASNSSSPIRIA